MLRQISIYTENRKGAMSAITNLLSSEGININAFVTNDSAEFGTVRMLVSDVDKANEILRRAEYMTKTTTVIAAEIPDDVGSLNRLLGFVEKANINIDYLYASFDRESAGPIIVIRADDLPELEAYLRANGYHCH